MKNPFVKCPGPRCYIEVKIKRNWLRLGEDSLERDATPHLFCCAGEARHHIESVVADMAYDLMTGKSTLSELQDVKACRIITVDQEPAILDKPVRDTDQAREILELIKRKT